MAATAAPPTFEAAGRSAETSPAAETLRRDNGRHFRVVIVGAGFAGIGAGVQLRRRGIDDFVILERGDEVGGTWRDNTYPGCQCDVPSHLYSFSFAPNPGWTRTYSKQAEILDYLRRTAAKFNITRHVRFNTPLTDAAWDSTQRLWRVTTPTEALTADALIMGNGPLSEPKLPDVLGLESFRGTMFHSADWRAAHDIAGERVAVVGTGASAIQFVPYIQTEAASLKIFQRTAPWVLPHRDRPIRPLERALYRRLPVAQKIARGFCYVVREASVPSFATRPDLMRSVAKMASAHLSKQIADTELRAILTPSYTPGCKRLLLSNDWYPALTQPNVEVVPTGVREVRRHSVVGGNGEEYEVDTIIFATGFHVTDNPVMQLVHGRDGRSLADVWLESGMRAHKGTTVSGFPNLFLLAGPNTGIGHTSLVFMIEAQLRYVMDALDWVEQGYALDVRPEALSKFNSEVQQAMAPSVWNVGGCASWYQDSQGRNPTIWPDFTFRFRKLTRRFDVSSYSFERRRSVSAPTMPTGPALARAT